MYGLLKVIGNIEQILILQSFLSLFNFTNDSNCDKHFWSLSNFIHAILY